jgi:O-antigen ligase
LLFFKKDLKVAAIGSALMAVFITAAIVFLPPVKNKVASIADLQKNPSNVERLYLWRVARDMIAHSPITGVGFRQWGEKVPEYSARYSPSWKFSPASFHHAHNTYLQVAAETGLVGLALFLGFWLNLTALAFRLSARYPAGSFVRALNLGTAFSIINLLIGGLFEDNFGTLLIALILSYVVSLSFFAANGKKA